ncbi:hypothetical protein PUN4_10082 [Paraburkholderia unamae]|nr:hypothetical protein PUN4_10082 [Paraburkholderia unamae]
MTGCPEARMPRIKPQWQRQRWLVPPWSQFVSIPQYLLFATSGSAVFQVPAIHPLAGVGRHRDRRCLAAWRYPIGRSSVLVPRVTTFLFQPLHCEGLPC